MRFMYLAYGIPSYDAATGDLVVDNYKKWNSNVILVPVPNDGSSYTAPQPGDILSYNSADSPNHTSLVIASQVGNDGNGTITVLEQNFSSTGTATLYVGKVKNKSNEKPWVVAGIKNWLHHTIDVIPQTNLPGTQVRIKGEGFGPDEIVTIRFDYTTLLGTTMSSGTGTISTTTTVPLSAQPGRHTIQFTGETSDFSPQTVFYVPSTPPMPTPNPTPSIPVPVPTPTQPPTPTW
jgi:hypothetical protein